MSQLTNFDVAELARLRSQLLQLGPDYNGAGEVIQAFLTGRGYGISPELARNAAVEFGASRCSMESIGRVLEHAARFA